MTPDDGNDRFDALEHVFQYHAPKDGQPEKYVAIREAALNLAKVIEEHCPSSADRTTAYRAVREAVMWANASIACGGHSPR